MKTFKNIAEIAFELRDTINSINSIKNTLDIDKDFDEDDFYDIDVYEANQEIIDLENYYFDLFDFAKNLFNEKIDNLNFLYKEIDDCDDGDIADLDNLFNEIKFEENEIMQLEDLINEFEKAY